MDLGQLGELASRLLEAVSRFGGGEVDANSVMNLANEGDPSWANSPTERRRMYQALELLERQSIISRSIGGGVRITRAGNALAGGPASAWLPDPNEAATAEWIELQHLNEAIDSQRSGVGTTITRLQVDNWRQFGSIDLQLHSRLTILTGANAAGKTTLLNLFAPHFNWRAQLISRTGPTEEVESVKETRVGRLYYSNGVYTELWQQTQEGITDSPVQYPNLEPVPGIFISSHRSVSSYRPLETLPARFSPADTMLQQFAGEVQSRYSGGSSQYPPLYRMKEALVAAALHGYGNDVVRKTQSGIDVWEGFQEVLRAFLPPSLRFTGLLVENGELLLKTAGTEFPIEAASGGISAMMELSWQIFLRKQDSPSFTVCIDEPENHLHPELQRQIVPSLLEAFPQVSFIVATHSPFVVTSTPDCHIYALGRFEHSENVTSRLLDSVNASATADETLQSVLGLDTTLPLWAQDAVTDAISNLPVDATIDDLRQLRSKLINLGLDRQFPAAIAAISEERN